MAKFKSVDLKKVQASLVEVFKKYVGEPLKTDVDDESLVVEGKYDGCEVRAFVANPWKNPNDSKFSIAPSLCIIYKKKVTNGASKAAQIRKFNSENKYFNALFWEFGNEIWISHTDLMVRAEDAEGMAESFFAEFFHKTNQAKFCAVWAN